MPPANLERIREYRRILAVELARLCPFGETITPVNIQHLYQGAILHDIGKVAITDEILDKTEPLTAYEEETLRNHTLRGGDVIKAIEQETKGSGLLVPGYKNIASFHHEHWDEQGSRMDCKGPRSPWKRGSWHWPMPWLSATRISTGFGVTWPNLFEWTAQ